MMDASGSHESNRAYYDAFSQNYEAHRGENDPGGYHELLDELEAGFVQRFGAGRDVLEVGCGTGLVLRRIERFARAAEGVDLSPGMLERARRRGLRVSEGSATELPFANASFDVTCSFKVLAHVPDVPRALGEMLRVTRPGGHVLAEFYNPLSLRGLLKRVGPPRRVAANTHEEHVYTRFHTPQVVREMIPEGAEFVTARGIRIVTPAAVVMRVPLIRDAFRAAERALCDSPASALAGFWIAAIAKH